MVGLYPIYDPKDGLDRGRAAGLACPVSARTTPTAASTSTTTSRWRSTTAGWTTASPLHQDVHDGMGEFPDAKNPAKHPEWWGKTFYKHFPNHGFVGDIFTVNGTAYPVMEVKRRKYRFRFLDASVARIYEFKLMASTQGPKSAASLGYTGDELEGQYRIPDGQQCMKFTQIASDGGLLPFPITRDSFELWPAKRREVIIDFTRYQDGTPTTKGDVVYLTNVMKMPDGRMWTNSSRFAPRPGLQGAGAEVRDRRRRAGRQRRSRPGMLRAAAAARQLADHAGQPPDLRGPARQRRRRDRVAHQRQGLRPHTRGHQPEEQAGKRRWPSRRRTASTSGRSATAAAAGCTPSTCTWRSTARVMRNGKDVTQGGDPGHPDDVVTRGPRRARPGRVGDHLPRVPRLRRALRRPLPQPGARGPRHDVRLGDHAVTRPEAGRDRPPAAPRRAPPSPG